MQSDSSTIASLAKVASDYGPFLFAILFTVIIPFRAYQSYSDCIAKYSNPSTSQSELISQSKLYFRSAWIAGLVLIGLSIIWWFYLNASNLIIIHNGYMLSYDGDILGVTRDDNIDTGAIDTRADSQIILSPTYDGPSYRYTFHILSKVPISAPTAFQLLWLSNEQTASQDSGYGGSNAEKVVSFRYDPAVKEYELDRTGGTFTIKPGT